MTILECLESEETDYFCGCACFVSLLPFCSLLEDEREKAAELLLEMAERDAKAFAASRGQKEEDSDILSKTKEGYQLSLSYVERMIEKAKGVVKRQLVADKKFLLALYEMIDGE